MVHCLSLAILVDLTRVRTGCMSRVLHRIVFLLPYTVFQIYNSAGNRPDLKCVCMIVWPVVMSLSSNWLFFVIASIHVSRCLPPFRSVHLHAALNTIRKVVSYFGPSSISLILCRRYVGIIRPWCAQCFSCRMSFYGLNIFFKVKMLQHLWWCCTDVISSLPMYLMMSRTGMTLDFCGFQQSFPWVPVLQRYLPLNSGKCNPCDLAALVGCINLLNSSWF